MSNCELPLYNKCVRYNIGFLKEKSPISFGKFMMALLNLEESDDWYRICGIHGNTFKPNDPSVLCPTDPTIVAKITKTGEPTYCPHSVEPFVAWHAPYIHQFELLLNQYNSSIDKEYITLPYFDITDEFYDYSFMNEPTIVILHNGKYIEIRNPLASAYYYKDGVKTITTRNGYLKPSTYDQIENVKIIRKQLYQALLAKTYEEFSSNIVSYGKQFFYKKHIPIETPHNSIHDAIGGDGGNMSDISISAFDPIFWLHHCNIDRFYYNWLFYITSGFKFDLHKSQITETSLRAVLAPFVDNNPYSDKPHKYIYGWMNDSPNYLDLKTAIDFNLFHYTYEHIEIPSSETIHKMAYIEFIDIPIPMETIHINAFLYPSNLDSSEIIVQEKYFAGSTVWFGINRLAYPCERCMITRTSLKIDIYDYITSNNINLNNIGDYSIHVQGLGRIKKVEKGFLNYTKEDIIQDGNLSIYIEP